jgi:hypothetical protein
MRLFMPSTETPRAMGEERKTAAGQWLILADVCGLLASCERGPELEASGGDCCFARHAPPAI